MLPQIIKPFKSMIQFFQPDSSIGSELNNHQNNNTPVQAPISFSAQLISSLQAEHRQVVELYRKVGISVQRSAFQKTSQQLAHLK